MQNYYRQREGGARPNERARLQPGAVRTQKYQGAARRCLKQGAKRAIVTLALWGFLAAGLASWLLLQLGLVAE